METSEIIERLSKRGVRLSPLMDSPLLAAMGTPLTQIEPDVNARELVQEFLAEHNILPKPQRKEDVQVLQMTVEQAAQILAPFLEYRKGTE
jgi:hypothetical protein